MPLPVFFGRNGGGVGVCMLTAAIDCTKVCRSEPLLRQLHVVDDSFAWLVVANIVNKIVDAIILTIVFSCSF